MGDIAEDETTFYSNAEDYWREVPPTVDGMLGGYGSISNIDINGSKAFLKKFLGVRNVFSNEAVINSLNSFQYNLVKKLEMKKASVQTYL